ncbi:MAG: extracellular solute-binding protein [Oscillospiraceae bacterium]|nr:extracellular solute-binding protein [Oscillospiraceae bacterium]
MKKWIALPLCLVLALGCFTGCDKGESTETQSTQTEEESAETTEPAEDEAQEVSLEGQSLTVYTALTEDSPAYAVYMEQVAAFEAATGATVTVDHYGENLALVLDSALSNGSTVDVFEVADLTDLQRRQSSALDLSTYAEGLDTAYPALLEQIRILCLDRLMGIPYGADLTAMWYNKASFEQAGVDEAPADTEAFEAVCGKLAEAGYRPIALDRAYVHANFGAHLERSIGMAALSELVQNGGWSGNEAAASALQTLIDWVGAGYFDENAPVDWPFSQLGLADRTVMIYANMSTLAIAEEMIGADLSWGCFPYPGTGSNILADCGALCVNAETLVPELAWEYIRFMTTGEADKAISEAAGTIPNDSSNIGGTYAEAAAILAAAEGIRDPGAAVKSGTDLTEVIENIYRGTYPTGTEAAAALDALY